MIKFCFLSFPLVVHSFIAPSSSIFSSTTSKRCFSHIDRYKKFRVASRKRAQARLASSTENNINENTQTNTNTNNNDTTQKDRPFSLPPGEFAPKQSLGQNFLSDQNYVRKIVEALVIDSDHGNGTRVVEIGPGAGALTRVLYPKYPNMTAIELDQRSVNFLQSKLQGINIIHTDVLTVDWPSLASTKGGRLNIIANLPYYIVSQVLFSLADSHKSIAQAVVTMQLEVAERLTAVPSTKDYGIPSVVFQLYCRNPKMLFKIPPTVFFPPPKVDSALVKLDFTSPNPLLETVCRKRLRK